MYLPEGRSGRYAIWKACERFGIRPPGVRDSWDTCDLEGQSGLISYDQIRSNEEAQMAAAGMQWPL